MKNVYKFDDNGKPIINYCVECEQEEIAFFILNGNSLCHKHFNRKNINSNDFWYIDLNGRIQHNSYQPTPLDECGLWFRNKFKSCAEACIARDKIRKLLVELNPEKNEN